MSDSERISFEEALQLLQQIVAKLEDESTPLETAIELYEQGIQLSHECAEQLQEAKLRIEEIDGKQQ